MLERDGNRTEATPMLTRLLRPARSRQRGRPHHAFAVAAFAVAALVLSAACTAGSGDGGPIPSSPGSPTPSVEPGSPEPTPGGSPSPDPSAEPTEPGPSPSGSPSPSPSPAETMFVRAYFFMIDPISGEPGLVPVLREVPKTVAVATAAINELLGGPTDREAASDPPITTAVPDATQLLGISIADGVATIDLSREFEAGGGSESILGRLAQVVYTLTQFPTVDAVSFELDGEPVSVFGGEGVILDEPVGRSDYYELLPEIFVDRPAWGAAAGAPVRVTGLTRVFEATFGIQVLDGSGDVIRNVLPVTATCGTGCWGSFDVTVTYSVPTDQWGTLRVYSLSARDGEPINIRDYPVWLTAS
jgi:hypothetical protein